MRTSHPGRVNLSGMRASRGRCVSDARCARSLAECDHFIRVKPDEGMAPMNGQRCGMAPMNGQPPTDEGTWFARVRPRLPCRANGRCRANAHTDGIAATMTHNHALMHATGTDDDGKEAAV